MKSLPSVACLVIAWVLTIHLAEAQDHTLTYSSQGYFNGINLTDSLLIKANFEILIEKNEVKILAKGSNDGQKDTVYLERRTMSPIKYQTLEGIEYYVWKLGDRKMVFREINDVRYLSLYTSDDYGLPAEYITFKIEDEEMF